MIMSAAELIFIPQNGLVQGTAVHFTSPMSSHGRYTKWCVIIIYNCSSLVVNYPRPITYPDNRFHHVFAKCTHWIHYSYSRT